MSATATPDQTIERTSIVAYALFEELHAVLADPHRQDEVCLGLLMGLSMFLDEKIGPMRADRLMAAAPAIILKTDAHVRPDQLARFLPTLQAFGEHLALLRSAAPGPAADALD